MEQILNNIFFICFTAYAVALIYDYLILKLTVKVSDEPIGKFEVVSMLVPGINVFLGCLWSFMFIGICVVKLIMLIDEVVIKILTDKINEGI